MEDHHRSEKIHVPLLNKKRSLPTNPDLDRTSTRLLHAHDDAKPATQEVHIPTNKKPARTDLQTCHPILHSEPQRWPRSGPKIHLASAVSFLGARRCSTPPQTGGPPCRTEQRLGPDQARLGPDRARACSPPPQSAAPRTGALSALRRSQHGSTAERHRLARSTASASAHKPPNAASPLVDAPQGSALSPSAFDGRAPPPPPASAAAAAGGARVEG